jgi:hypothetical protein
MTWQQLGLSQEWYNKECRVLNNDMLKIKRELDLEWTKATDNSVFTEELIETIFGLLPSDALETCFLDVNFKGDPDKIRERYSLKVYKEIDPEEKYLIGVDTGGGTGKDNSAFTIVHPRTMEVHAVFKSPKINTSYYTSLLQNLIEDLLTNSILIIEANSYGKTLIDNLVRHIPDNVFYDIPLQDKDKDSTSLAGKENIKYGVYTTETSRNAMIDLLVGFVNDEPHLLAIPEIYEDVKSLIYNKRGKVEHDTGKHDDVLMSYLFVRYAVAYSNTIHLFLRKKSSMVENAAVLSKVNTPARVPMQPSLVNKVEKVSADISELTIQELIEIRDKGISVQEFLKMKNKNPALDDNRKKLTINKSTFALLR